MQNTLTVFGGTGFVGLSIYDCFNQGLLKPFSITRLNLVSRATVNKSLRFNKMTRHFKFDFFRGKGDLPEISNFIIVAFDSTNYNYYDDKFNNKIIFKNFKKIIVNKYPQAKILYLSSGAIYGKQHIAGKKFSENYKNFNYKDLDYYKLNYSLNKKFFEENLEILSKKKISISIARCFTFVGPRLPLQQNFAIGNFFLNLIRKEPIKILSKRQVIRSYMCSKDLVFWLLSILNVTDNKFKIFNVGSEISISLIDLAKRFKKIFKCEIQYPKILLDKNKSADIYVPNCKKIITTLNLNYEKNIDKLIINTYEIIKRNEY